MKKNEKGITQSFRAKKAGKLKWKIIKVQSKVTDKIYYGLTCNPNVDFWWNNILTEVRAGAKPTSKLHNAIRATAPECFTVEVVDFDYDMKMARQVLRDYIEADKTFETGLNTLRGVGGVPGFKMGKKQLKNHTQMTKHWYAFDPAHPFKKLNQKGTYRFINWNGLFIRRIGLNEKVPKGWQLGRKPKLNIQPIGKKAA